MIRSADLIVKLRHEAWQSGPMLLARRRQSRWRGVRGVPAGWGLVMRTRSVHGFGLRAALLVAGIDRLGRIRAVRMLRPGRVVAVRHATWIAELPAGSRFPPVGVTLDIELAVEP